MASDQPSDERPSDAAGDGPLDVGLLSPVRAGTAAEALTGDAAWLRALLDAEAALARAQARLGLVPADAADTITQAARAARPDPAGLARRARGAGNPVVPLVADLRALAGDAGRHVHHGATSQDIMDTAGMLVAARTRREITGTLGRVLALLAELAERHRDTPMPGRTLSRQALPTTFGLKAAQWLLGCLEGRDRLVSVALPVQLGGAVGTLAAYGADGPALAGAFADELGLDRAVLPWHTRRTPIADLACASALVTGALGKIATDVALLAQSEVDELAEPAAPGRGGSSAMPHKRNPALATLVRSAALQVPAQVQVLLTVQAAAHERPAGEWHAEWQPLRECLRLTGGAAATTAELLDGVEVRPDRMRAHLDDLVELLPGRDPSADVRAAGALVDRALTEYRKTRT
ncbi:3-carboxy-cis,cis-muconate cycloisomerase [Spirillospora sp. NPDC052269]